MSPPDRDSAKPALVTDQEVWEARSFRRARYCGKGGPLGANLGAPPPRCPQTGHYFEYTIEMVRDRL